MGTDVVFGRIPLSHTKGMFNSLGIKVKKNTLKSGFLPGHSIVKTQRPVSRRQEYAAQTRQALIDAASLLFAQQGFRKTSLARISEQARVTKGALYHHFQDKEEIFCACYRQQIATLSTSLAAMEASPDLWDTMWNRCRAFLAYGREHRSPTISLQEAISVLGWERWRAIDTEYTMGLVRDMVEQLVNIGFFKPHPVGLLSELLYGMLVECSMSIVRATNKRQAFEDAERLLQDMLLGLKAELNNTRPC